MSIITKCFCVFKIIKYYKIMTTLEVYIEERLENQIIKIDSNNTNIEIFLNKGSSFGSNHSTTSLSLQAISYLKKEFDSVYTSLDLGSGSGILSILMKKLGTNKVFSCEIDEYAKKESILNFKSNFTNESHHPTFIQNPLEADYSYDLIAANISGSYLPNNFNKICKIINTDGYLIISGFNINKEQKYSSLAFENGLKTLKTFKDSPWLSIVFQKK